MHKIIFFAKDIRGGTDVFLKQLELIDGKKFKKIFCFFKKDKHSRYGKNRVILNRDYPQETPFTLKKLIIFLKNIPKAYSFIKSERPSLLVSCDTYSYFTLSIIKIFTFKNLPYVAHFNNNIYFIHKERHSVLYSVLIFSIIKIFSRTPNVFVFVSRELAQIAIKKIGIKPRKIEIIYHCLNLQEANKLSKERLTATQKKIIGNNRDLKILSVGRLDPQKDFHTLLQSFSLVLKDIPRCRLIILGDGALRSDLKKQTLALGIRDKVVFAGWQNNIYKFLKRADLFVFSSHYEGFPISILEALSCGIPVISTASPTGPREILDYGKYGFLVNVGDYKNIAALCIRLLKDKRLRVQFSKMGLARIQKFNMFTTQKIQFELLFNNLLEKRSVMYKF